MDIAQAQRQSTWIEFVPPFVCIQKHMQVGVVRGEEKMKECETCIISQSEEEEMVCN